jgi:hypothetical protein
VTRTANCLYCKQAIKLTLKGWRVQAAWGDACEKSPDRKHTPGISRA